MSLSEFTFTLAMLHICVACLTYVIKQIIHCVLRLAEIKNKLTYVCMDDDDTNHTQTL